jgi:hypothetical protein
MQAEPSLLDGKQVVDTGVEGILERDEDDCMDEGGRAKQEPEPKTVT